MLVSFLDFIVKNCYNSKEVFSYLMYKTPIHRISSKGRFLNVLFAI
nr:MAG TPA: hypothetical protein [Caudoviricetes sp.]